MPAYLRDEDVVALKWVAGYPANKERGLPYITGLIVLNDAETGLPLAVMDGAEITAARTAAASGVCVRGFAPGGWRRRRSSAAASRGDSTPGSSRRSTPKCGSEPTTHTPSGSGRWPGPVEAAPGGGGARGRRGRRVGGPDRGGPEPADRPEHLGERWLALPIDFDFYFGAETVGSAELSSPTTSAQFEYYRSLGHFQGWPGRPQAWARPRREARRPRGLRQPRHRSSGRRLRARVLERARDESVGQELRFRP